MRGEWRREEGSFLVLAKLGATATSPDKALTPHLGCCGEKFIFFVAKDCCCCPSKQSQSTESPRRWLYYERRVAALVPTLRRKEKQEKHPNERQYSRRNVGKNAREPERDLLSLACVSLPVASLPRSGLFEGWRVRTRDKRVVLRARAAGAQQEVKVRVVQSFSSWGKFDLPFSIYFQGKTFEKKETE